jgi:CDP-paratose 2-epimerase
MVESLTGKQMRYEYVNQPRSGDHICYISDLSQFQHHYPKWSVTKSLDDVFRDIVGAWTVRLHE